MNKREYAEYEADFKEGTKHLTAMSSGCCAGCSDCGCTHAEDQDPCEPWFSWSPCGVCGSTLGGDREPFHGIDCNGEIMHYSVCVDCVYYTEYGHLDDMTMMEIEKTA